VFNAPAQGLGELEYSVQPAEKYQLVLAKSKMKKPDKWHPAFGGVSSASRGLASLALP
jgi:hypothetical protein